MASHLGIDVLPDRVRGVLVRTQLRRIQLVSYIEVPIVADAGALAPSPLADAAHGGWGQAPAPGTPGPFGAAPSDGALAPPPSGAWPGPGAAGAPGSPFGPPPDAGAGAPSPFGPSAAPFGTFDPPAFSSRAVPLAPATASADVPGHGAHGGEAVAGASGAADVAARVSAPPSPLSAAVAELLRRAGVGPSVEIVACLAGEHASLRRIELPKAAEKKIDELLPFEMESLLPFDQAETLLDHQPIDADAKQIRLLVCAATKSRIREALDLLAGAGADPTELVPGAVPLGALGVLVPALAGEGPHAVISVRPSSTDVCIVRKGRTELARTLSSGSNALAVRPGGAPSLEPGEAFVRELKQTFLAWRMQDGPEPETVFVAGDALPGSGIGEWLSSALGRTVLPLALPEPQLAATAPDPAVRPAFATALGLALHATLRPRHIDLRKGDMEKKRSTTVLRELAPVLGVAAAAVACAFMFSLWARYTVLSARRELLETELARVTETRLGEETRSASRARRLLAAGRRGDDPMPPATAYDLLVAISAAIPDGVAHDVARLHIDLGDARSGGRLEIQGSVATIEEYDRIADAIAEIECLHDLERGPLTNAADGRRNYRLEADVLCAEPSGEDATASSGRASSRDEEG